MTQVSHRWPTKRPPWSDPTTVHVEFVADKVAMGRALLPVLGFHPVNQSTNALHSCVTNLPPMQYNLTNSVITCSTPHTVMVTEPRP
jgi:hypothetical protein